MQNIESLMRRALDLAAEAAAAGEVPIGAVVVDAVGNIISEGRNNERELCDPTAHAEMIALRAACQKVGNYRLPGCSIFVTLEPCTMCLGAMVLARIDHLYYGADSDKSGGLTQDFAAGNHKFSVTGGVLADEAAKQLAEFFAAKR